MYINYIRTRDFRQYSRIDVRTKAALQQNVFKFLLKVGIEPLHCKLKLKDWKRRKKNCDRIVTDDKLSHCILNKFYSVYTHKVFYCSGCLESEIGGFSPVIPKEEIYGKLQLRLVANVLS